MRVAYPLLPTPFCGTLRPGLPQRRRTPEPRKVLGEVLGEVPAP